MVCSLESACACVPRCGPAGARALRWLFRVAGLVVALAINPLAAPVRAAGPADPVVSPLPPAFPRQGLALENPGRGERPLIPLDPVAARIVAGTWTMPAQDEMVTFRNGLVRRWQPVQATPEGTFDLAGRGSYLAHSSGDTILNSSELGMVSLRQVSFGKEEETRTLKPFVETLRV